MNILALFYLLLFLFNNMYTKLSFSEKYYLMDAAYTHTRGFMTPYRNVCYWLSDFRSGGKAVGREEIFNLCHA